MFVDLDRFKSVNDEHGHAVGDAVLAICAQRIASAMRRDDVLARYGGDEFVLMLSGILSDEALDAQLARLTAALDQLVAIAGIEVTAGGSCGGALYPRDGRTLEQLVKVADARMYGVKRRVRGGADYPPPEVRAKSTYLRYRPPCAAPGPISRKVDFSTKCVRSPGETGL